MSERVSPPALRSQTSPQPRCAQGGLQTLTGGPGSPHCVCVSRGGGGGGGWRKRGQRRPLCCPISRLLSLPGILLRCPLLPTGRTHTPTRTHTCKHVHTRARLHTRTHARRHTGRCLCRHRRLLSVPGRRLAGSAPRRLSPSGVPPDALYEHPSRASSWLTQSPPPRLALLLLLHTSASPTYATASMSLYQTPLVRTHTRTHRAHTQESVHGPQRN